MVIKRVIVVDERANMDGVFPIEFVAGDHPFYVNAIGAFFVLVVVEVARNGEERGGYACEPLIISNPVEAIAIPIYKLGFWMVYVGEMEGGRVAIFSIILVAPQVN